MTVQGTTPGVGHRWGRVLAVATLAAAALATAACGTDETSTGDDGGTATTAVDTTAPEGPPPASLEIVARDHAFELGGVSEVPAGALEITLRNEGAEDHAATIARYKEGKSFESFVEALTRPDAIYDIIETFGGPNAVAPGDTGSATVVLEPGSYLIICMIPSPDGIPHLAKGMQAPLTVTDNDDPAALPATEEQITLLDYAFGMAEEVPAGSSVTLTNEGQVPHELTVYAATGDATAEEVLEMASSKTGWDPVGPAPFKGMGGVSLLDPGHVNTFTLPPEPGEYVFLCFLPTPGSGAPHHTQGMAKIVTLT